MIFLGNFQNIEGKGLKATFIHSMPFDDVQGLGKTEEELNILGVLIDELPIPNGDVTAIYVNKETKEVTYEYQTLKTKEQMITGLQEQLADLQATSS